MGLSLGRCAIGAIRACILQADVAVVLAVQAAAIVATATTRPNGLPATAANVAAALHDLAPAPAAAVLPAGQLTNGGMGSAVADPLDFLLTQMSLSLDELELPELPSL